MSSCSFLCIPPHHPEHRREYVQAFERFPDYMQNLEEFFFQFGLVLFNEKLTLIPENSNHEVLETNPQHKSFYFPAVTFKDCCLSVTNRKYLV